MARPGFLLTKHHINSIYVKETPCRPVEVVSGRQMTSRFMNRYILIREFEGRGASRPVWDTLDNKGGAGRNVAES